LASHNEEGGINLTINASRPEWRATNRITDDEERRNQLQRRLGTEWGVEEVVLQRNIDEVHTLLEGTMIDGENAPDIIEDQLTSRASTLAEMQARIFEEEGVEYWG
jgi:hypothetical protein